MRWLAQALNRLLVGEEPELIATNPDLLIFLMIFNFLYQFVYLYKGYTHTMAPWKPEACFRSQFSSSITRALGVELRHLAWCHVPSPWGPVTGPQCLFVS